MDILKIVRSRGEFDEMLALLVQADRKEIGYDTETSSLRWHDGFIVGHCLACSIEHQYYGFYVPVRHEDDDQELDPDFVEAQIRDVILTNPLYTIITFNGKFDAHFSDNHGMNLGRFEDSMILMFLRNPNEPSHRLKKLSTKYIDPNAGDEEKEVAAYFKRLQGIYGDKAHYGMIPVSVLGPYGALDPVLTLKLWRFGANFQPKEISDRKNGLNREIYDHEMAFTQVIRKMERTGVPYDVGVANKIFEDIMPAFIDLEEHIYKLAGRRFKIGSNKELDVVLRNIFGFAPVKTSPKTGEPLWGKGELMATKSEIGECVAAWRNLDHSLSAFDEGIKKYVHDGRIHCSFNQIGARTGRTSASEPNLQQMPKRLPKYTRVPVFATDAVKRAFQLRRAFRAPEGYRIVSIDESQFELRLLGHYSNDARMLQAFIEGKDIHTFTASLIFGIPYEEILAGIASGNRDFKRLRDIAKEINFAIVYGAGIPRLLQTLTEYGVDTTYAEVKKFRYKHSQEFSDVSSFIDSVQSKIRRRGYIFNYYGRHSMVNADKAYVGVNYLIQGVTADMLKDIAIRNSQDALLTSQTWLAMMIHDESLYVVHEKELDIIHYLKETAEDFSWVRCPILAEVSIGPSWGELEPWHG